MFLKYWFEYVSGYYCQNGSVVPSKCPILSSCPEVCFLCRCYLFIYFFFKKKFNHFFSSSGNNGSKEKLCSSIFRRIGKKPSLFFYLSENCLFVNLWFSLIDCLISLWFWELPLTRLQSIGETENANNAKPYAWQIPKKVSS